MLVVILLDGYTVVVVMVVPYSVQFYDINMPFAISFAGPCFFLFLSFRRLFCSISFLPLFLFILPLLHIVPKLPQAYNGESSALSGALTLGGLRERGRWRKCLSSSFFACALEGATTVRETC